MAALLRKKEFLPAILLCAVILTLTSCRKGMIYSHYESAPIAGWERIDTLKFDVSPVSESGYYHTELGLRIVQSFPFTSLTMIVTREILPEHAIVADTVSFTLMNKNSANFNGNGIALYQYSVPLRELRLEKGDSLHITVNHYMRREILPGVNDVGITMLK